MNKTFKSINGINFTYYGIILQSIFLLLSCNGKTSTNSNPNDSWPIFRGDPSLSAYTNVSLPDNPTLYWTFNSHLSTNSSLVVYNRIVYWSSKRGDLFGIDCEGNIYFEYAMETAVVASPMIHNSVLYIGCVNGFLHAISLTKREKLWSFETRGQISASPNIMNLEGTDVIIIGSYDNFLYCIASKTGKEINRFESSYYINGAVAQSDKYAVFGGCDGWVRVVDCINGIQTDSLDIETYIPASPAIFNNQCYIFDNSENFVEINLSKGKIVSSKKIILSKDATLSSFSIPAVSPLMVYWVSCDKHLYAMNRKDRSSAWKYLLKGEAGESAPIVCKNKLLVCTKNGIISIHNAITGNLLWEFDTGEQIMGSPAVINDYFFVLTSKGRLFCFGEKV